MLPNDNANFIVQLQLFVQFEKKKTVVRYFRVSIFL